MRIGAKIGLFFGSYSPLLLLLALLNWQNELFRVNLFGLHLNLLPVLFIIFSIAGVAFVLGFMKTAKSLSSISIKPTINDTSSPETLAYLITYLVPFIGFQFASINALVANAILFCLIGFLYIQSNLIYLNPVLNIIGYRIYRITLNGEDKLMLAKSVLKTNNVVNATIIFEGLYIESDNKRNTKRR